MTLKKDQMHTVYFLVDGTGRKSYIGYSNDVWKRFRTHYLKLKASAKRTKAFNGCKMVAYITGFSTHKMALSYEWYAKRPSRRLKQFYDGSNGCYHRRIPWFMAPLHLSKFEKEVDHLSLHVVEGAIPAEFLSRHGYDGLVVHRIED